MRGNDVRGAARLAAEATAGLVDLVEAMHERIARVPLLGKAPPAGSEGRTGGITGLVYKSVRGVTRLVGGSVDAVLGLLVPTIDTALVTPEREAVVAALNGVLGDHLAATHNPLATTMALRVGGQALVLEREALAARLPAASGRLLVLVHGLCMNDLQWHRGGHDHGATLARELGFTPVYLHYNTGLHVADNGRQLAALLDTLVAQWPQPVERLVIIGHSMGGLVARSAIHQAQQAGLGWPAQLSDLVCLGTPHHGAPLERAGHGVDLLLGATPYSAPFTRLARLRSAGITDLRHGRVLDADEEGQVPLPAGVRCHAVAACLGQDTGSLKTRVLGDGLVPVDSALGRHKNPLQALAFAPERLHVVPGLGHLDLLGSAEVCRVLKVWLV